MEKWFSSFEKSIPDEERFCLESPLTSYFYFLKGKNWVRTKTPNDSSMEKAVYENLSLGSGIRLPIGEVPHVR